MAIFSLKSARGRKAKELAQDYLQRKSGAIKLIDKLLAGAGSSIDGLMVQTLPMELAKIERIDRLTAIAETRRNAMLREIDRRRAVLGGPKTARGRSHAARNALRHALSLPVYSDPVLFEEVEALAREIIGTDANPEMQELARRIAEAQIDLRRVRDARRQILSQALIDPDYESEVMLRKKSTLILHCLRRLDPSAPMPDIVMDFLSSKPEGPYKFATILADKTRQLLALDRYERRALSRRKFAIRAFDAAGRRKPTSRMN